MPIAEPTAAPTAISGELKAMPEREAGARQGVLLEEDLPDASEPSQHRLRDLVCERRERRLLISSTFVMIGPLRMNRG